MGDIWVRRGSSAVLEVPSALIPDELNYLLNPSHSAFEQIVIGTPRPLDIDPRVFSRK
jgi:hypothetical protein